MQIAWSRGGSGEVSGTVRKSPTVGVEGEHLFSAGFVAEEGQGEARIGVLRSPLLDQVSEGRRQVASIAWGALRKGVEFLKCDLQPPALQQATDGRRPDSLPQG